MLEEDRTTLLLLDGAADELLDETTDELEITGALLEDEMAEELEITGMLLEDGMAEELDNITDELETA